MINKNVVAIVGRPNVGKSALFNRLIGFQKAIVEDIPGVTRDRIYGLCEWNRLKFTLIDTGGIDLESKDDLRNLVLSQAYKAISEAKVLVFVVDVNESDNALDYEIAQILRTTKKKVFLAVNKCDSPNIAENIYNFYNLGFEPPHPVSGMHGIGTGDLLDLIVEQFSLDGESSEEEENLIKVSIAGRPNVGKSSLFNVLCGEDRAVVNDKPGTTLDTVDTIIKRNDVSYLFTDTAGFIRKSRLEKGVEEKGFKKAVTNIKRADIVLFMMDARESLAKIDKNVAGLIKEEGKGAVIIINKVDLMEFDNKKEERNWRKELIYSISEQLDFLSDAPLFLISAKEKKGISGIFEGIDFVWQNYIKRIDTSVLNKAINESMLINPPPVIKGKQLKLFYISQIKDSPPLFIIKINNKKMLHYSYVRYIENQIRKSFGFEGCPIKFIFKEK